MNQIIGKLIKGKPVHIWGAGVSGLVLAYYLQKAGYQVSVFEKSSRVGGKIGTKKTKYGPVELAANAIFLSLIDELGLTPKVSALKLKRHLYLNKKFTSPLSFKLITRLLLGFGKKVPQKEDLNVEEYLLPFLGKDLVDHLVSPSLGGVYASEAKELDMESLFPEEFSSRTYGDFLLGIKKRLKKNRHMRIKGSVSFEGGMQIFIDALAAKLKDVTHLNYQSDFKLQDNTILCTDAITASELLKGTDFSPALKKISYTKLSSTTVYLKEKISSLQSSFGVLIPRDQGLHTIGILSNKDIFPFNYGEYSSYTFISPEVDDPLSKIKTDLQQLAPEIKPEDFLFSETNVYPQALPLYNKNRKYAVRELHQIADKNTGIVLFGNYVAGISLREMITAAKNFSLN
jgi:oxygen-dependent protoporphyrinogen oxidase